MSQAEDEEESSSSSTTTTTTPVKEEEPLSTDECLARATEFVDKKQFVEAIKILRPLCKKPHAVADAMLQLAFIYDCYAPQALSALSKLQHKYHSGSFFNDKIQERRLLEAKSAVLLERALNSAEDHAVGLESSALLSSRLSQSYPFAQNHDSTNNNNNDDNNNNNNNNNNNVNSDNAENGGSEQSQGSLDSPFTMLGLASIWKAFHPKALSNDNTKVTEGADNEISQRMKKARKLESRSVENESLARRRLRFAKAAVLYEQCIFSSDILSEMRDECYYRLGRSYAFGLGVDVSDETHQKYANMQAMEYLLTEELEEYPPAVFFLSGLMKIKFTVGDCSTPEKRMQEFEEGINMLSFSSNLGHLNASLVLAHLYETGNMKICSTAEGQKEAFIQAATLIMNSSLPTNTTMDKNIKKKLRKRAILLLKLASSDLGIQPGYQLACQVFRKLIDSEIRSLVLSHLVSYYLQQMGNLQGIEYPEDVETNKSKEIADILVRPFNYLLPSMESDDTSTAKGKTGNESTNLQMIQITQFLRECDTKWQKKHAESMQKDIRKALKVAMKLSKPFGAGRPVAELAYRILKLFLKVEITNLSTLETTASTMNIPFPLISMESIIALIRKWNLEQYWSTILSECGEIFSSIEYPIRSLNEQEAVWQIFHYCKNNEKEKENSIAISFLARRFMREANISQTPKTIQSQIKSAMALIKWSETHRTTIEEARRMIENEARKYLSFIPNRMVLHLCCIGYDVLIDVPHLAQCCNSSKSSGRSAAAKNRQERINQLMESEVNKNLSKDETISRFLLKNKESSLTACFLFAKEFIDTLEAAQPSTEPKLSVAAVSYDDPWMPLLDNNVEKEFQEAHNKVRSVLLRNNDDGTLYEGVLDTEIISTKDELIQEVEEQDKLDFEHIFGQANSYSNLLQRLEAKQKLLFMLRRLTQRHTPRLVAQFLLNGLAGRCSDGQQAALDNWLLEERLFSAYKNLENEDNTVERVTCKLQLNVGLLLADCRRVFLQKHCSPFMFGESEFTTSETKTATQLTLQQILRLPLSLPGSFNEVLYPGFALDIHKNPEEVFSVRALLSRYFFGGGLEFEDKLTKKVDGELEDIVEGLYTAKISFGPTSLASLGKELRKAIVDDNAQAEARAHWGGSNQNDDQGEGEPHSTVEGLNRTPVPSFVLEQSVVADFLRLDSVLSPWWTIFTASECTMSNVFFNAEGNYVPGGSRLSNQMADAAVLRILEVCGYAEVPDGFYERVSIGWNLPNWSNISNFDLVQ